MDFIKPGGFGGKFRLVPADLEPSPILEELTTQLMREKENACYEDFAASIRKHYPGIQCTGAQVAARVKELVAAEKKPQESDCETCGKERFCQYAAGQHDIVRINCPLWRAKG